jgi:hypothetical protein
MKAPYIGVTGPVTPIEAEVIASGFAAEAPGDVEHRFMIGYLVSSKTLEGKQTANRRYPAVETIPYLAEAVANVQTRNAFFQTLHYNTKLLDTLDEQIRTLLTSMGSAPLDGIQLNMPWPPLDAVARIKNRFPALEIIFQANSHVLALEPHVAAERIATYGSLIDHVLIDASGGAGVPLNLERSVAYANAITAAAPNVRIGHAGGLQGQNAWDVITGLRERHGHRDFSVDAEGGLRRKLSGRYGDDLLDYNLLTSYQTQCLAAFSDFDHSS